VPLVAQTAADPPSTPPLHRLAVQPAQTLFTQKPFAGFAHWPDATHSTHWPAAVPVVAQTEAPPSTFPAHKLALQAVQTPATQKPLAGFGQSLGTPQVPAESGARVSAETSTAAESSTAESTGASTIAMSGGLSGGTITSAGGTGASVGPSANDPASLPFSHPGKDVPSQVHRC
jgi:hypothetical protein